MGLFNRKKSTPEVQEQDYTYMTVGQALAAGKAEKIGEGDLTKITGELCEQVTYLRMQQEEIKVEYGQITQYLADIQRFEQMDEGDRRDIADSARMMLSLDAERERFQKGEKRLRSDLYHTMQFYSREFPRKITELERHENYLNLIRDDMRNLEGEKGSISYEKDHSQNKKEFLYKLSYGIVFAALLIFILLIVLSEHTRKDFTVPFFITGIAVLGYILYFVYAVGACKTEIKRSEYKMNRANILLNKIKIKYVNTTSLLDYSYDKYNVNSLQELRFVWESYQAQKEEEKKFLKNTQLLENYTARMMDALNKAGMERADAWICQPEVFLDRVEMADFKDAVSRRRNKLRARIDYNIRQQDSAMNEIEALKAKYAGREDMINEILRKNGIE